MGPQPLTRALASALPLVITLMAGLGGCASVSNAAADPAEAIASGLAAGVPRLRPVVLGTLPHDTDSWTQGLEIADGVLYEGTGLAGSSQLRELDPSSGRLLRATPLPDRLYGEGITVVGGRIWQLTWTDGVALDWDRANLAPRRQVPWHGEGWGLCHTEDGRVIASDGSDQLRVLTSDDLAPLGAIPVRINGRAVPGLNELECVPGAVWANVYQTDWLVRIDLASGAVTAVVDAGGLLPAEQREGADVLNGIAAIPGTDQFLLTGKLWPMLLRVRFIPA